MYMFANIIFLLLTIPLCALFSQENALEVGKKSITLTSFTEHVKQLGSDEFEGRAPSSAGETMTINYLRDEFNKVGAEPGNGDSYLQEVPLVSMVSSIPHQLRISSTDGGVDFQAKNDYVAVTRRLTKSVGIENSELVFAGFGIVAPEYGWNDYKGLDCKGKTVVVMVNDPGFYSGDPDFFGGKAMTYYGRWTYKYEEAARQGADGIFIIHDTAPAGYPWVVVEGGWTGEQFYMKSANNNMSRCKMEGWISVDAARQLFSLAGENYQKSTSAAMKPGFKWHKLNTTYSLKLENTLSESRSNNIIGMIPGTDLKDEVIIYTAHWDHFGIRSEQEGDQIYNGARDNATGTAALIEIARAFKSMPTAPRRSILLMAVTAEEQGLLGSAYYAANPIYPLEKTVAVLNMDAMNIWGPMNDVTVIGLGSSELDAYAKAAAKLQNRVVNPDPQPEKGIFYRSDHFSFAKHGVPALYTKSGIDHIEHGSEWALKASAAWTSDHYHKPSDEYDEESWDLNGAVDDIRLMFLIGSKLGNEASFPNWYEGNEFRAVRDKMMKNHGG